MRRLRHPNRGPRRCDGIVLVNESTGRIVNDDLAEVAATVICTHDAPG